MKHSKTGLFLIELILGILFFALTSAICIQIFVKANTFNNESIQKDHAMRIASYIIEISKSQQLPKEDILYFDHLGNTTHKEQSDYIATITKDKNMIHIDVSYHQESIYSLDYYLYQQRMW